MVNVLDPFRLKQTSPRVGCRSELASIRRARIADPTPVKDTVAIVVQDVFDIPLSEQAAAARQRGAPTVV
jgi:hypothetical protein